MKKFHSPKLPWRVGATATTLVMVLCTLSAAILLAADASNSTPVPAETRSKPATKEDAKPVAKAKTESKPKAQKLTGADLYAVHCNRCHAERYPTEFNAAQWKTLMLHMRVRANLPASQAKSVLKYLQEEAGN